MPRLILDSSVLISFWRRKRASSAVVPGRDECVNWATQLSKLYDTRAIVTPVRIEFLCGARDSEELALFEAFLSQFEVVDDGTLGRADWEEAERVARRVPRDGRPRQLGDCLIWTLARRLRANVESHDTGFPRGRN